jgi:hypothetical protein
MYLDPEHLVLHLYHEQDIPIYVNTDLVLVMVMPLNQLHNRLDQQGQLDLLLVDHMRVGGPLLFYGAVASSDASTFVSAAPAGYRTYKGTGPGSP